MSFYYYYLLKPSKKPVQTHSVIHSQDFISLKPWPQEIFHCKMDVLASECQTIHTLLFLPSSSERKTCCVCDQCAATPQQEWVAKHDHDSHDGSGVTGRTGLGKGEERKNNSEARRAQNSRVLRETQMKSLVWLPQLSKACNYLKRVRGSKRD